MILEKKLFIVWDVYDFWKMDLEAFRPSKMELRNRRRFF